MSRSRRYYNHPLEQAIYARGYKNMDDFCKAAEINYGTLYSFLSGRTRMFTGYIVNKIARALHVTPNEVIRLCEAKSRVLYY